MHVGSALLSASILIVGFALGRLTADTSEPPPAAEAVPGHPALRADERGMALTGRARPPRTDTSVDAQDLTGRLERIESLLLVLQGAPPSPEGRKHVVQTVREMWMPVVVEAIERDRFERTRAGVADYLESRLLSDRHFIEDPRQIGCDVAHLMPPIHQIGRRLAEVRAASCEADLVTAMTDRPDEEGAWGPRNARRIVRDGITPYGDDFE